MSLYVDIEKVFNGFKLRSNFEAGDEAVSILGASGSGKSLTLKAIAGIVTPDKGKIILNGKVLFDSEKNINLSVQKRGAGYLFQNYALFPNMNVEKNIECAINKKTSKEKIKIRDEMIERFSLQGLRSMYPDNLSGGQQQKVALARIFSSEYDVLMLDEPFSAFDTYLRDKMERELMEIVREIKKTIIFVSHNYNEVYRICDKIGVIDNGLLTEVKYKKELFERPTTKAEAMFTGCMNIAEAYKIDNDILYVKDWGTRLEVDNYLKDEIKTVGIRQNYFEVVEKIDKNVVNCKITGVIEEPEGYKVWAKPVNGTETIMVDIQKHIWKNQCEKSHLFLKMPKNKIYLMR